MGSFQIARVFGIPIRAHITLIIVLAFIAVEALIKLGPAAIAVGSIMIVGLLVSVVLHEVGHSLVAIRKGCRVRDILLLPIGGVAQLDSMPTNPKPDPLSASCWPWRPGGRVIFSWLSDW
jgi:Zn-dependent protease